MSSLPRRVRPQRRHVLALGASLLVGCYLSHEVRERPDGARPIPRDAGPPDAFAPPSVDAFLPADAGPRAPPPVPCDPAAPLGTVRAELEGITGQPVFSADGETLYAPAGRDVIAVDRCTLEELWRTPGITAEQPPPSRRGRGRPWTLRRNDEFLIAERRDRWQWYDLDDGRAVTPFELEELTFVTTRGAGALLRDRDGSGWLVASASETSPRPLGIQLPFAAARSGDLLSTFVGGWSIDDGERWVEPLGLLDGTGARVLPAAVSDDQVYGLVYGVTSYDLVARRLADGRRVFRSPVARTERGQQGTGLGQPVVGATGNVYVYANSLRSDDEPASSLSAFGPDGERIWHLTDIAEPLPTSCCHWRQPRSHLVGRGEVVYLATETRLLAIHEGRIEWTIEVEAGLALPYPALGEGGDLVVHTDDDRLLLIPTRSSGLARSPWPSGLGGPANPAG